MTEVSAPATTFYRWIASYGAFNIPQAAGPIAFALLVLPLTGDADSGAAVVLSMTAAQLVGAVPVARLGRHANAVSYLKLLVVVRTLALILLAVLAAKSAGFTWLLAAAAVAGFVNGAAFGCLRSILNHLVVPSNLPRALGLATTVNEVTFVAAPVAAAALGSIDPVWAVVIFTLLGAAPAVLLPRIPHARAPQGSNAKSSLLTGQAFIWLGCTLANTTVIAAIEVGAVPLAMNFGYPPSMGFLFTVALCIASILGGLWVSFRNRMPSRSIVLLYLVMMSIGSALVAANLSVVWTVLGAILVGLFLAPLATYYSLMLDAQAPAHRKVEVFALLRTSYSLGIILASGLLALVSLSVTLIVATATIVAATLMLAAITLFEQGSTGRP